MKNNMFSQQEKQHIAAEIEKLLLSLNHPEMPTEKPMFELHVIGKESWSWAHIMPNWTFTPDDPPQSSWWNEIARRTL